MGIDRKQFARALTASVLVVLFAVPRSVFAQAAVHLVSPSDLQNAAVTASRARQGNIDTLNRFFSSEGAHKALKTAHMDSTQVTTAVAGLSDQELAQLAARANHAQADFAAGSIDNRDLLIILVGLAALILIIVAVDH